MEAVIVKDTKYACVVMVSILYSLFLCGLLTFGSLSVLVYIWSERFRLDAGLAAWAPAIMGASYQLTGPFLTMVMQLIGHWKFHLVGATLTFGASLATAFASEYWHVILSFSIIQGVGGAIIEFTSTDMIAIYTEKYKDKMYAALVLAFSIGMSVTPSLMEYLISVTSYQTALIILAMPNLLSFPIALVYRGRCNADMCATKKDDNSDSAVPVCPERKLSEDNPAFEHISEVAVECENNSTSEESGIDVDYVDHRSADSKDGEYEQNTTINDMNDVTIIKQNTSSENNDTDQPGIEKRSVLSSHLFVFKDTAFILYLVYNMFAAAGEFSFHAFAVDYSVSLNILTLTEAALGMTLTSVSLCAAAIFMTVLSHWKLDRIAINVFVVLFMGISVVCVSLSNSQAAMYTCFIIFGFTEGVYISNLTSYVASGFEHSQYMIIRLSYVFVVTGIGALVGPIIAGHFAKTFGMKYLFFFLGALPLSAFFILLPYWLYKKLRQCSSHGKKETIEVQECRN